MLQVEYRLKLGQDEFLIKADVKDEKEFFEKMSFYSSLPKTAPGGSNDLKLSFRQTKDGYTYYSLVSEKEQVEYRFGQLKDQEAGALFPKGWAPVYKAENDQAPATQGAPAFGNPTTGPAAAVAPPPAPPTPQAFAAPAPQPTAAPAAAPVAPAVQQAANHVLARFGIQAQK
jgi:hypothetical protein